MRRTPPVALAMLAIAGCGGAADPPAASSSAAATATATAAAAAARAAGPPALCRSRLRVRVTGHVDTPAATELSGLVLSRTQPGVLWTENDSGNPNHVFAGGADGTLRSDVTVTGATNVDWEDIALGRLPGGGAALLVADIGDNLAQRDSISVYRVPEPRVAGKPAIATAPAQRLELRYPDGPRDAEALLVDPTDGALVVVEKSYVGRAGVYVAEHPAAGAPVTMRRRALLRLGVGDAVTGGDVSADGSTIALRTYDGVFVWRRRRGETVAASLRRRPCSARTTLPGEGQGEALALTRGGGAFYTVPEGERPAIRRYASIP
jgi:hypothetical protein